MKAPEDAWIHTSHPWSTELIAVGVAEARLDVAARLNRIRDLDPVDMTLTVEAGVDVPISIYRDGDTIDLHVKSSERNRFLKGPSLH